jgi:pilus assembly protein CpaF
MGQPAEVNRVNKLWSLIQDLSSKQGITEIIVNGPKSVFVEQKGSFVQLDYTVSKDHIYEFIDDVAGFNKKECNDENPILDGNLPDGSRVNIIREPFSYGSPAITIRKYIKGLKSFDQLENIFGLSKEWVQFLKAIVKGKLTIMISGGTGVGKTTFLNLLLNELDVGERVVTIEDTLELNFDLPNCVRMESRKALGAKTQWIKTRDLVKNALRMRPDRIIIGETRGEELFDLLQAVNTGHEGSMSSVHANSSRECLSRLETLFLMSGYDVPLRVVRRQITDGLDIVIQIGKDRKGRRVVKEITEIGEMEGETILTHSIAKWSEGRLTPTGLVSAHLGHLEEVAGLPKNFFNSLK